jgi:hypothetical protein
MNKTKELKQDLRYKALSEGYYLSDNTIDWLANFIIQYAQRRYDEGFFDGVESVRQSLIPNHQTQQQ